MAAHEQPVTTSAYPLNTVYLLKSFYFSYSAHIRYKGFGNSYAAILPLVILRDGYKSSSDSYSGAVKGMYETRFATVRRAVASVHPSGLEVLSKKGEWVPFTSDADTIVVNIGDMLQRLTNHVYPSTTHRVTNPPGEQARQPRYSVPFFLHPNPDFLIDVLPSTVTPDNPKRYPEPITAQGYLEERLREIKLK